jgi:hypothetical protein
MHCIHCNRPLNAVHQLTPVCPACARKAYERLARKGRSWKLSLLPFFN